MLRADWLPHQVEGIDWLTEAEAGGIRLVRVLADAAGLDKTVQAFGVIADALTKSCRARLVVMTPSSLLNQWESELATCLPTVTVTKNDAKTAIRATVVLVGHQLLPSEWTEVGE